MEMDKIIIRGATIMNLTINIKTIVIFCLFALLLVGSRIALSCPADPPKAYVFEWKVAGDSTSNVQIEIDGYSAIGSQEGDSCAAAVVLPNGIRIQTIEIVDSRTGRPVGFGSFKEDSDATFGFCPISAESCIAFTTKVEKTIPTGVALKMIIKGVSDSGTDNWSANQAALEFAKSGMVVAGGVDESGTPNHHLSIFRPFGTRLEFAHK